MPTARQKARRESASSTAASGSVKVRKSSVSHPPGSASMRPRANTISHVDNATLGMLAAANSTVARHNGMDLGLGHVHESTMGSLPGVSGYQFRGMSTAAGHHGPSHGLPKLDTNAFGADVGSSMRTAPPYASFGGDVNMEGLWYGPGNTINPAQLHFSHSPTFDPIASPYNSGFFGMAHNHPGMEDENTLSWMSGFDNQMSFSNANEQAIDGSSPSAMSTGSHDGLSDLMFDGANNTMQSSGMWQPPVMAQTPLNSTFSTDYPDSALSNFYQPGQLSPRSMQAQMGAPDHYVSSPPPINPHTPLPLPLGTNGQFFQPPLAQAETPSNSAESVSSSNRQSSVTSISADSITDATRQALLASLSQPSAFSHNNPKTTQPSVSSPLSPAFATRPRSNSNIPLPSTYDLQRYIAAYVKYFHPHLPFLHIPSLSFDSPDYTDIVGPSSGHAGPGSSGIAGGAGSLVLAMAAIGAFYEYDAAASKDLFEMAKRMIQLYLEERRKMERKRSEVPAGQPTQSTPLWLIQAMLLNVIYGHNCGDKTAAGIATNHCAALISLARAADLARPFSATPPHPQFSSQPNYPPGPGMRMVDGDTETEQWSQHPHWAAMNLHNDWQQWVVVEERKRTLYTVFILSSLLVSAYNHAPALMNSEIELNLPCDEESWAAETADAWAALQMNGSSNRTEISFASALGSLLTASQRDPYQQPPPLDQPILSSQALHDLPESDLKPSTFGCLILINALHNYIWETRQRHMGRPWTPQDTESMHAHIQPALRAWHAAWAGNPQHSLERPNPFGVGSLSADCIPLLDLAHVRLFVNLGRSKEAFFQRDWDTMATELAGGDEFIQHADSTRENNGNEQTSHDFADASYKAELSDTNFGSLPLQQSSRRERHLRKAAYLAADSLAMSDKLGVTFADFTSRELPVQSALCAFDCAQVLAEWCAAIQDRVGPYLGILGKDDIDFSQVPAVTLLNGDDVKLFTKIHDIIRSAEIKMADSNSMSATQALQSSIASPQSMSDHSYGSKILLTTANMLAKAAVWPVTHEMAQALQSQAIFMDERAQRSVKLAST
ncbi:MAG: hypothetical protein Q9183_002407 [Haloplaca sp. 2 TL-2023]